MIKILAFSDIHSKVKHCEQLVDKASHVDIVVGAGDFGNFRKEKDLVRSFDILKNIQKPFVIVPGNHESLEELQSVCAPHSNIQILHGTETTIDQLPIFGIGGGIPVTPFGSWSYDFTEEDALEMLANMSENGILISHSPPKGTLDKNRLWMSLGSTTIRDVILSKKPKICVCGHIHESSGKTAMLENTQVVNAGPKGIELEVLL